MRCWVPGRLRSRRGRRSGHARSATWIEPPRGERNASIWKPRLGCVDSNHRSPGPRRHPLAIWFPPVGEIAGFLLTTIWVNGPLGVSLPATYEPILIILGRLYPALAIAAVGTAGIIYVEAINYVLYRRMFEWRGADRVRESR